MAKFVVEEWSREDDCPPCPKPKSCPCGGTCSTCSPGMEAAQGAVGGSVLGAIVGFFLGGPVGAAIGAGVGGVGCAVNAYDECQKKLEEK